MSVADAVEVLTQADPDRLAALTLLPPADRATQIALHALAAELARVPRTTDEPMLAEIRLQWWVDELARLPDSAGLHPLLAALVEAPGTPAPTTLAALAAGQRPACEAEPFADLDEALAWIDATFGALAWIAAETLGAGREAEAAIRAQGRALGVAHCMLRGSARAIAPALHDPLRDAGRAAASDAARAAAGLRGPARIARSVAPVLLPSPDARAALLGEAPPSEFARRRAMMWFALRRDWRFEAAS